MSFQPRLPLPRNTAAIFQTTDDFFAAVLGPSQHDAHVVTRTRSTRLADWNVRAAAANAAVAEHAQVMIARIRAEREALR